MQADSQTRVIDAPVDVPFFRLRDGALKPRPRFLIAPRAGQAVADLMQAASQTRVIDAPVDVPFFLFRDGALEPRPRFLIAPYQVKSFCDSFAVLHGELRNYRRSSSPD